MQTRYVKLLTVPMLPLAIKGLHHQVDQVDKYQVSNVSEARPSSRTCEVSRGSWCLLDGSFITTFRKSTDTYVWDFRESFWEDGSKVIVIESNRCKYARFDGTAKSEEKNFVHNGIDIFERTMKIGFDDECVIIVRIEGLNDVGSRLNFFETNSAFIDEKGVKYLISAIVGNRAIQK